MGDAYSRIDAINWSRLKHLDRSPLHFRYHADHERDDERHFRIGRAIHTSILEPDAYADRHPVFDGVRRGKAWEAFCAEHPGADILTEPEHAVAIASADAIRRHPIAKKHLHDNLTEKILTWTDADTGVACKARVDSVNGHLVELKSVNGMSFDPRRFGSTAARLMYHGQLAFYADGLEASGYTVQHAPAMIAVQSDPPHDVAVYIIGAEIIESGRRLYKRLLEQYVACVASKRWPGVCADEELRLHLPAWVDDEEDEEPLTIGGEAIQF